MRELYIRNWYKVIHCPVRAAKCDRIGIGHEHDMIGNVESKPCGRMDQGRAAVEQHEVVVRPEEMQGSFVIRHSETGGKAGSVRGEEHR